MSESDVSALEGEELSVRDFTPEDRDFLQVLANNDGTADTSTIRSGAALKRKQVHYRYEKLEELGVIEVERVGKGHDGRASNTATLTEYGRRLVDDGLCEEIADPTRNFEELEQQVNSLKGRIKHLEESRRWNRGFRDDRIDELEERIEELEENVSTETLEPFTHKQEQHVHKILRRRLNVKPENVGHTVETILPAVSKRVGVTYSHPFTDHITERFEELAESDADSLEERIERLESAVGSDRPRDA